MLVHQHERFVEELDVQLGFNDPITTSGSVMTLPATATDLRDWMADERKFLSVQYDDWMQVIGDFRDSLAESGPKLVKIVDAITTQIESLLLELIALRDPDPVVSPIASFLQKVMPAGVSYRVARPIDSLLRKLVPRSAATEVSRSYAISDAVRADIQRHLERPDDPRRTYERDHLACKGSFLRRWQLAG